jgi:SAM-dependent methyltransferase
MQAVLAYTFGLLPGVGRAAALRVLGLKAEERGQLLDVGCGSGVFLARMKQLGWQTVGYETDPIAAQFAREKFGLTVKEGSLADVGLPEASFDVVTLSHVIEHVHSPGALVMQCQRLLKPNGKLIILTPNTASLGHRIFRRAWRGLEPPRHIQCFHPRGLRSCVESTGMLVEQLTTESRMMQSIWYASLRIRRVERGGRSNSAFDYITSFVMEFVESAALHVFRDVGEEILLVATMPPRRAPDRAGGGALT